MNFFTVINLMIAVSGQIIHRGVLFFHDSHDNSTIHGIGIENGRVFANDRISYVNFDENGALMFEDEEKYLKVNRNGKLGLTNHPQIFTLSDEPGSFWKKHLFFEGNNTFQLCGDDSIGFKSNCKGAETIQLDYELCWPFQLEEDS